MAKLTIEVVMIVKNEEAMLARCLESVKDADKITIVDTGSTDTTVEIAKKYTKNVYTDYKWNDNFAEARNHALAKATCDWILSIDADEFLDCSMDEVRKVAQDCEDKSFKIINITLASEREGQIHYYPRLFKRHPEVFWAGVAHNHVSIRPTTTASSVRIVYGYSPAHEKDPERTVRILEAEVKRNGGPREMYYLGREYWYRARYKDTLEILLKYVDRATFLAEKADAYLTIARCYYLMGMADEARNACMQCLIINSHFKEAILFMSDLAGAHSNNPTWQKNAEQWARMAETASNEGVLFIR